MKTSGSSETLIYTLRKQILNLVDDFEVTERKTLFQSTEREEGIVIHCVRGDNPTHILGF